MSDRSEKGLMDIWRAFTASSNCREIVAGGVGGVVGVICGHPLDTLKIRMQQSSNPITSAVRFRHIIANEGFSVLCRGMRAPAVAAFFQNALIFETHAGLKEALAAVFDKKEALAGFGAGFLQSFLLSPVELVKIRLQLQQRTTGGANNHHGNDHRQNAVGITKYIFRREGIRGIYRGLTITILRDAPAFAIYFGMYDCAREQLDPGFQRNQQNQNYLAIGFAGVLAGVCSWIFCYPFDVVKTRLQAQVQSPWDHPPPKYLGIIDCFRKIIQEEGFRVLGRGLGFASVRAVCVNGPLFVGNEWCKQKFFPQQQP